MDVATISVVYPQLEVDIAKDESKISSQILSQKVARSLCKYDIFL